MRLSVHSESISAVLLLAFLSGCSLNPSWLLDSGYDWDPKRKRSLDTERNRRVSTQTYASYARREASGESGDWNATWKNIFKALEEGRDNPEFYKRFIIEERRKYGLRKLPFAR
jgi:hypothetical protein